MKTVFLGWMIFAAGLSAAAVLAQTPGGEPALPPALDLPPVASPQGPDGGIAVPAPAPPQATSQPSPVATQVDRSAEIAALRETFETLRERDTRNTALRQPASSETLARIDEISSRIAAGDATARLAEWRAQNLGILAGAMTAQGAAALPEGIPAGTRPDIALAVLDAQATLYSRPSAEPDSVIRVLEARTTMLRVAETGAFTLVWSAGDGFAFVLSQFREVF